MILKTTAIRNAIEDDRDKPSGAGVAPERQEEEPRARTKRGKSGSGKQAFFPYLARMLFTRSSPPEKQQVHRASGPIESRAYATGEFENAGRILCARLVRQEIDYNTEHTAAGDDSELSKIIAAITEDVERWAAGARQGVSAKYAGQIDFARKHLPRHLVAGAIRAIIDNRSVELAFIRERAAAERAQRIEIAFRNFSGKAHAEKMRPPGHNPNRSVGPSHS
jgi:hypothetical protein